jgi:spore maturation protein CgeB
MKSSSSPGREVLVARTSADALRFLEALAEGEAGEIARRARERVLLGHTATVRAMELERHIDEARGHHAAGEARAPSARAAAAVVEKVVT